MNKWIQLADKQTINKTIQSLKANGINAKFVENAEDAKKAVLSLIPQGSEVMTMTSVTLSEVGLDEEINGENTKYRPIRDKLYLMNRETQAQEMNKMGGAPEYALGSIHAVTEDGHVLISSNTGSQLGAYAYGALNVIWIVGTQKIVKNTAEGIKRIYEYVLPLESERAIKACGVLGSNVSKLLIINNEVSPQRLTLILVGEKLGF